MIDDLDERMGERRRSIEEALADLRAKYKINPTAELARMIRQLEAEIAIRKHSPKLALACDQFAAQASMLACRVLVIPKPHPIDRPQDRHPLV
jgi:hypothetical protein